MIAATATLLALLASFRPASAENPPDPAFREQVVALAAKNDHAGIAKLVKQKKEDAIAWIVATCEKLANEPSDDGEKLAEALKGGWKEAALGEFAEREYKNLKELGPNRRDRNELKSRLDAVEDDLAKNEEHKDGLVFQNAVDELDVVAPGLEQVGDWYRASQAWIAQAKSYDEEMRGETAELHKAWLAYGHALEAREKIDLKDPVYEAVAKRKAVLLSKGADKKPDPNAEPPSPPPSSGEKPPPAPPPAGGAPSGAPSGSSAGAAPASTSGPITAAASFEALPTIDAYARPSYPADDVFLLWNGTVEFHAKGSTSAFPRFTTGPPLIRAGKSDLRIDTNGDGQGDEKLPIPGTPVLVKVNLGKGDTARPWACFAQVGGDKDAYQGIELNNLPTDDLLVLFAVSAASITANVAGTPIRIIDDDADSVYGNVPLYYANSGLVAGDIQIEMDSIVIGASKRARPWSEIQQIGDKWWKLEVDANAKAVKATPADIQTGTMKLDFQGPTPPSWIVVQGADNSNKNVRFDLVEGGSKGVVVPTGKYSFVYGEIRKGKRKQVQKVVIVPGKNSPTWQVEAGKTVTVPMGAPFGFDFKYTPEGDKIKVEGMSVAVVGRSAERYERAWSCVARPEVFWRKKGNKTAANKGEKMGVILDQDTLAKLKAPAAWFPLDVEVPLKGEKSPIEVQLVEKKHELFGKIESEWK